jgi:membrane protease YdiL (CAAX protease family)
VLSLLAAVAVPGVLVSFLGAAGEEIGWRGLLVPELTQWMGFRRAALVSGVIWGLWHVPLIVTGPYSQSGTPRWFQVGCFLLMVIFVAIAFAWLRMRSHSVWPTIMFHAAHNAFIQAFFDTMTADTGKTHYFTGEFGIAMVPFTFLLAVYCWRRNPSEDRLSISQ